MLILVAALLVQTGAAAMAIFVSGDVLAHAYGWHWAEDLAHLGTFAAMVTIIAGVTLRGLGHSAFGKEHAHAHR